MAACERVNHVTLLPKPTAWPFSRELDNVNVTPLLPIVKRKTVFKDTTSLEKMAKIMMPKGPDQASLSRMHLFGAGTKFFKILMKKKNVISLADLIEATRALGAKLYACEMTMGIMGISRDELIENIEYGGVETYLKEVIGSEINFMI